MRIPFLSFFMTSPFEMLIEHAEIVKECGWAFQQAMECYVSKKCKRFEEYREEVDKLESEADTIKRRIRGHIPIGTIMPVSKFQIFLYIKEQDNVLDSVKGTLNWLSYRTVPGMKEEFHKDFLNLVDSVIEPIEELSKMVKEAKKYFDTYSDKQRNVVKEIINNLRTRENEADQIEDELKLKIFSAEVDPSSVFHSVRLAEIIGSIADHAENAGDMMRAMISRKRGII
ncbi:MAG: TIGR00153 family protein [Thermodesulfobacteriota bacterium]|nr:TIGR00153 family protein [Thermodesulfobacteriota bacterium]